MPAIITMLLIAAAFGGGVSVMANDALPGDALWGFKTAVNENISGALALGDEAKAGWDISLAAARLDEAAKLAGSGKLSSASQAAIMANFKAHARDVIDLAAKLKAKGNTPAAEAVATRWQAELARRTEGLAQAPASFVAEVRGTLDAAANLSASLGL